MNAHLSQIFSKITILASQVVNLEVVGMKWAEVSRSWTPSTISLQPQNFWFKMDIHRPTKSSPMAPPMGVWLVRNRLRTVCLSLILYVMFYVFWLLIWLLNEVLVRFEFIALQPFVASFSFLQSSHSPFSYFISLIAVAMSILRRPRLFASAVLQVGVFDLLRFHRFTVGFCWITE